MIELQLDRLSPAERDLLEAASVAGQSVAVPLVAAALGCEIGDAELRCETLARSRRFLSVAGTTEWPDGSVTRRYAFTHELHRRVVYESIPEGQCARLHMRAGEALEAAPLSVEFAAESRLASSAARSPPRLALPERRGRAGTAALRQPRGDRLFEPA
jgi:predicted ATPase